MKNNHVVRDPIHKFVSYTNEEKVVIDSPQFQRLRDIHQLAMTYLIYPGASHKRFEHSLGVMELATNIFDVVMDDDNLTKRSREVFKEQLQNKQYWRQTLRMAALCHDVGHLPLVESLLMSRHWMYSQVYQHPTRKIYDEHLQNFLKELMHEENFKVNEDKPEGYLRCTDTDILKELFMIQDNSEHRLHNHANKLLERKYRFRLVYKQNIDDKKIFTEYLAQTTIQDDSPQRLNLSTPTELSLINFYILLTFNIEYISYY